MRLVVALAALLVCAPAAFAQQRPLVTEDPETIGAGRMLVEAGFDYQRSMEYPVSGLTGNLFRFPVVGVSIGIGSFAEAQIDGGLYNRLSILERDPTAPLAFRLNATGDSTWDVEDMVVGTKIKIVSEGMRRPSFALRSATKLPMASNEGGLGLDTIDFFSTLLVAKTVQSVRVVGNVGLGILSDPTRGDRQNDVLLYGVSFARAVSPRAEVVGEINGRHDTREGDPPPGTESRSMAQFGARYTVGTWRGDAAIMFGLTSNDPSFGVGAGFTYVFDGFPNAVTAMAMLRVVKAHAYGNDFIFLDSNEVARTIQGRDYAPLARAACDRHRAIGGDGVVLYSYRERSATMQLLNADGSAAEISGNGLRCLAALVVHFQSLRPGALITVDTSAGVKTLEFLERDGERFKFRASMGRPDEIRHGLIQLEEETVPATLLSMGNPQCVVLGPLPDRQRFEAVGPALSRHAMFPSGTNVEFAHVESPELVRILIWERGVGPTSSSGTGAAAAAVAAAAHGGASRVVDVVAPGGTQRVEWRDDGVYLTGWAEIVLEGEWLGAGL